ncbi:unnamed protein product [Caenorhabditis angaria]|uniref:Uncharacterized protein n=1 Tax=Caenorhabditis angaria TaxID=860376 RepID=A0A9P1IW02_9PELO|nr:unnamed protein product [Caenorhabditis angaria]
MLVFLLFSFIHVTLSKINDEYCYGDGVVNNKNACRFFTIVIDGGSTGTRLHLYKFLHDPKTAKNGMPFIVEKEIFQEVKPGLSSYHNDPQAAAKSINPLLERARKEVPHYMWEKTPITLRATAGLRLLPGHLADDILEQVESAIFNSGFFAAFSEAVSVMSGSDEGVFSWFTLNILLETLFTNEPSSAPNKPLAHRSVAAFDLGGGSTQLTFWPNNEKIFEETPGYERDIDFFGHHIRLFTHSFLGNGLIASRLAIMQQESSQENAENQLKTSCMPDGFSIRNWEYSLKHWQINGSNNYGFENCYKTSKEFVKSSQIMQPTELIISENSKPIYLFSYFFDRGLNSELVKDTNGGEIQLKDFKKAAEIACGRERSEIERRNGEHWWAWQCLDLTYIYSLLRDGYGFGDEKRIVLAKKIKEMEVSWGQGLAFSVANQFQYSSSGIAAQKPAGAENSTVVDQIFDMVYTGTTHVLSYFNLISA